MQNSTKFPVFSLINRDVAAENGSLETASSATKSLIPENSRSGFELSVRFAAFRGALRDRLQRREPETDFAGRPTLARPRFLRGRVRRFAFGEIEELQTKRNRAFCSAHPSGRSMRLVSDSAVRSTGWVPARIAATISGARKASGIRWLT